MRTGIIRCASSRACADALSCSNSRLFAVRQFDRFIVLAYGLRIQLHFPWCEAIDGSWLLRKCCSPNSALKHESRIARVWVQMWLGRWAKWSCRSYSKTESDRSKLFDDQRSYLFYHVVLDTKLQALRDECFSREHSCHAAFLFICKIIEKDSNLVDSASSIRLSQRLSHACLSINKSILWNCEWLIISVIVYLMVLATWITVVILELIHA